jgi:hypothetical protein
VSTSEKLIQELLNKIDASVNSFNDAVPDIQKKIFSKLQLLLKDLEVASGSLKNSITNIKAIGKLKSEIENIILNKDYVNQVADFAKAFNAVSALQNQYFSFLTSDFSPSKVLAAIKTDAIDATVTSLTEAGINANVTEGIQDILRSSITSGGKYVDLVEQMRNFILTNETGLGSLERYTRQITTDSLNQYSAQYSSTITQDLGLEWYMYTGSNLKTTRPFCKFLSEKKYIHQSELPEIIRGHIDEHDIYINPKTKVWAGGIPGTNESNFNIYRGGYNCGHQLIPVSKAMVPENIKAAII